MAVVFTQFSISLNVSSDTVDDVLEIISKAQPKLTENVYCFQTVIRISSQEVADAAWLAAYDLYELGAITLTLRDSITVRAEFFHETFTEPYGMLLRVATSAKKLPQVLDIVDQLSQEQSYKIKTRFHLNSTHTADIAESTVMELEAEGIINAAQRRRIRAHINLFRQEFMQPEYFAY